MSLAKDDSDTIHIDHHSPHIGNLLITSSVLILGMDREMWQARGDIAGFGQGVGA